MQKEEQGNKVLKSWLVSTDVPSVSYSIRSTCHIANIEYMSKIMHHTWLIARISSCNR